MIGAHMTSIELTSTVKMNDARPPPSPRSRFASDGRFVVQIVAQPYEVL